MELEFIRPILQKYQVQDTIKQIRYFIRKINDNNDTTIIRFNDGDDTRSYKHELRSLEICNIPIELSIGHYMYISPFERKILIDNFINHLIKNVTILIHYKKHIREQFSIINKDYDIILTFSNIFTFVKGLKKGYSVFIYFNY
jgi:hypothetical protein